MSLTLNNRRTFYKRITSVTWFTCTERRMVRDRAECIDSTRCWTWVFAALILTDLVASTIGIYSAFGSTVRRSSNVVRQARADRRSTQRMADSVRPTDVWYTWVLARVSYIRLYNTPHTTCISEQDNIIRHHASVQPFNLNYPIPLALQDFSLAPTICPSHVSGLVPHPCFILQETQSSILGNIWLMFFKNIK